MGQFTPPLMWIAATLALRWAQLSGSGAVLDCAVGELLLLDQLSQDPWANARRVRTSPSRHQWIWLPGRGISQSKSGGRLDSNPCAQVIFFCVSRRSLNGGRVDQPDAQERLGPRFNGNRRPNAKRRSGNKLGSIEPTRREASRAGRSEETYG
jgi:hypothetical protein